MFLVGIQVLTIDFAFSFILKSLPNILSGLKSDQKLDVSKIAEDY
jgi:hypothetical protein